MPSAAVGWIGMPSTDTNGVWMIPIGRYVTCSIGSVIDSNHYLGGFDDGKDVLSWCQAELID